MKKKDEKKLNKEILDSNIGKINPREITQEMRESYIDYAMSVIVSRALPDVRDGLKPVHRRILYAMLEDGLRHDTKFRKSATVVGSVLGRYHPHGDQAVYDALVRMAQDFSLRYPLIQGQGNFGCFTKDTKVRLCDGRNLNFEELIKEQKEGKRHWTFTFNLKDKKIEITEIKNPRLTSRNEKITEITLDNGEKIKCTFNHLFMLRDGSYKQAKDLKPGESLMPIYTKLYDGEDKNFKKYEIVYQPIKETWEFVHHLADEWNLTNRIYKKNTGRIRHHKDFNKLNNNPDNILRIQWQDPEFREKFINGVIAANRRRLKENPNFMKELAQKAKISLRKNWEDPKYKEKVIKSKILSYVYSLLNRYSKITPEIYEKERINNGIPKIENALNYFDSFPEILAESQKRNHKVVKIRILPQREDVYDLTIEPWHNFLLDAGVFVHNSIDGDPPSAMRYSEAKLSKIGEEMLRDIEKNTVGFVPNYDGTRKEPTVLPSPLPQLLLNGSLGIAVGMATNIPSHNLSEVCDALIYLLDHPKTDTEDFFQFIKGPDFPTGGEIFNQKEIILAYSQGKGPILTRGKTEIEEVKEGKFQIVITEIPFQVQKSVLLEKFASLVSEKKLEGIKNIRDESDREGMRILVELSREANPQRVLNRLYKFTELQKTFHLNMLALVEGIQPKVLNLAELLNYFLLHRKEVVSRKTKYDLEKAKERAHILEGLHKCLGNIDEVIRIIKGSANREEAQKKLMKRFRLDEIQANAILETKLAQLAKLERKKIEDELKATHLKIKEFLTILKSPQKIKEVIKKELVQLKEGFGDERRTKVHIQKLGEISEEDLIPQEETIITLTSSGYIKRINPKTFRFQKRGGKGILGMKTIGEDIVEHFLIANTHDNLLFFTDSGKVFKTPVYEIPEGGRVTKGRGLLNFLELSSQEKVLSLISLGKENISLTKFLVMVTKNGIIKKTALSEFENVRRSGLIAILLKAGDLLRKVSETDGQDDIILVTKNGKAIRFKEKDIRPMGRGAAGVKGIRMGKGDEVIGMDMIKLKINPSTRLRINAEQRRSIKNEKLKINEYLLVVTENGYGKRTDLREYRLQKRGGTGIKTAKVTSKTGNLVASKVISAFGPQIPEDLIVISQRGQVIRIKISQISKLSRATQGVRIMKLEEGDKVASATCI